MKNDHIWAKWAANAAQTSPKLGELHGHENQVNTFHTNGNGASTREAAPAGEAAEEECCRNGLTMEAQGDIFQVQGDIDLYVAPVFRQRALEHIHSAENPRLDLRQVPFLDSAGLAALLSLCREAKGMGKELRLMASGSPRRVLRITGIDRMLPIDD